MENDTNDLEEYLIVTRRDSSDSKLSLISWHVNLSESFALKYATFFTFNLVSPNANEYGTVWRFRLCKLLRILFTLIVWLCVVHWCYNFIQHTILNKYDDGKSINDSMVKRKFMV